MIRINHVVTRQDFSWSALLTAITVLLTGCVCARGPKSASSEPAATAALAGTAAEQVTTLTSAGGSYTVSYATQPSPIPLNEYFVVDVHVRDARDNSPLSNATLQIDGRMPHHRHGMNVQPRVTAHGDGRFSAAGMLFHMPGRWELYFDVARDGKVERAQDVVMLD